MALLVNELEGMRLIDLREPDKNEISYQKYK
jgi:hypothetical protein